MSGEFRLHDMTALPAELWRFHVLNSAVCALGPNDDVNGGSHGEENGEFPNIDPPFRTLQQSFLDRFNTSPRKENPQGDQYKAEDENNRDKNKDNNPDVRIIGVTSKLDRRTNSQENLAVVTSATPSMLIHWLVSSTSMGRFGSSFTFFSRT
jgi:hypothetical protein